MNLLQKIFTKAEKKSTLQLIDGHGWIRISDLEFKKGNLKLELSDEHQQWNITDSTNNARICGTFDNLEEGLIEVNKYI